MTGNVQISASVDVRLQDSTEYERAPLHSAMCAAGQHVQREDLYGRLVLAVAYGRRHARRSATLAVSAHLLVGTVPLRPASTGRRRRTEFDHPDTVRPPRSLCQTPLHERTEKMLYNITHGQTPTILQHVVQHVCLFVRLVEFDTNHPGH